MSEDFEETGEETSKPGVAVGWGAWRDADGDDFRVVIVDDNVVIEYLFSEEPFWPGMLGAPPFRRLRARVAPRSGAELRRWMVAHPGEEVVRGTCLRFRWSAEEARFELSGPHAEWMCADAGFGEVYEYRPADGGGWER